MYTLTKACLLLSILFCSPSFGCSFSASTLNFGVYNPVSNEDINSSANVTIQGCLLTLLVNLKFTTGNSNSYGQRYLTSAETTDKLNYNLYLNSSKTNIWGDGTQNTSFYSNLISITLGGAYNIPIYSRIEKKQIVAPGMYSDNIQVYIAF